MLNFAGTCKPSAKAYTLPVAYTVVTRGESRKCSEADNRRLAVFFRPKPCACLQWSGLGGGALAHAGSLGRRSLNPALCPATSFESEARVLQPVRGGRIMRQFPHARSGIAYRSQTPDSVRLLERVSVALLAAAKEQRKPVAISLTGDAQNRPAALATEEAAMPEVLARSEQSRPLSTLRSGTFAAATSAVHQRRSQGQVRPVLRMTGHSIGFGDRAFVGLVDAAGNERPYDLADALALAEHIDPRDLRNIAAVLSFDAEKGYLADEDIAVWLVHEPRILELLGA